MPNPDVTLYHPKLGEITSPESSVRLHEAAGWSRKAPSKKAAPAVTPPTPPTPPSNTPTFTNSPDQGKES